MKESIYAVSKLMCTRDGLKLKKDPKVQLNEVGSLTNELQFG